MSELNTEYSFVNYNVEDRNKLAVSAAEAIIESPGIAYNPLFICGDKGTGKTHLLNAIGLSYIEHNPDKKILFITIDELVTKIINALRDNSESTMFEDLFSGDVLLVDDVHCLSGRNIVQDVFLEIFDYYFNHHKQIVLISNTEPCLINNIQERLRARFSYGMIVTTQQRDNHHFKQYQKPIY
jgi:chromosomal replication initiator protein